MNAQLSIVADPQARERDRLIALDRFDVLETPREETFDRIVRLARSIFRVPMATVSLIDGHRQWHKSFDGLSGNEAPREHTFCNRTIQEQRPLVVTDAATDPRFCDNPFVTGEPGVRFYAGIPLRTQEGHSIGTLCIVDTKPRDFGPTELEILSDLARVAMEGLELRLVATTDTLTGAMSRRTFKDEGKRAVALAFRHHHDLSCIAFDLDHFKSVNDTFGHSAGDAVLAETVRACTGELRKTDRIGRLGGEEFGILLPNTGRDGALQTAEKMRRAIEALRFDFTEPAARITASFGVASLTRDTADFEALLNHADAALYKAKAAGRNRCSAFAAEVQPAASNRRRVLKGGRILFNERQSSIDCTIRSLSDLGAGIDVYDSLAVPKRFDLVIPADQTERACRVVSKTAKHVEAEFC
jgi:diguanylate cyclase (GGDEF)-like protein